MKICLIFPRFKYESGDPPLGIAYIASYLHKFSNVAIDVLDTTFDHSYKRIEGYFLTSKPDIVGVYLDTIMYNDALEVIRIAKKHDSFVIAGGPHPTILPKSIIKYADILVFGQAERPLLQIIENFRTKNFSHIPNIWYKKGKTIHKNKIEYEYGHLDKNPFPSRNLLCLNKYIERCHQFDSINPNIRATTMIISRGCPYNCSFCQPTLRRIFGSKFRIRSPDNTIEEILEIKQKYDIQAIFFHDDTLTVNKQWIIKFCEKIKNKKTGLIFGCNTRIDTINEDILQKMYAAGFRELHIGIESASQRILDEIYKKGINIEKVMDKIQSIKKMGFNTMCFFMIGAPTEKSNEIKETIRFACSLPTNEISVSITNPIPETELFFKMHKEYSISRNYGDFDYYSKRAYKSIGDEPSYEELKKFQRKFLCRFYASPKRWIYILKHISTRKGIKKMIIKLKRFR
jgi:radical SAM superfamily enzyme YgiQ (UPF0313 family)